MNNLSKFFIFSLALLSWPAPEAGADELEYKFGGMIQSDLRFRPDDKSVGSYYKRLEWQPGVARNENIVKLKLDAGYGDVSAKVDIDFVWLGHPEQIIEVGELADRARIDPYYLQTHAAYIQASDLFIEGLDLRIGQQLVLWGVGDQFNPTNNLNSNDVEDVLMFGEQIANFMLRLDYSVEQWSISGVLVPVFKPAQLPHSAGLGLALVDRTPFAEQSLRLRSDFENAMSQTFKYPTVVSQVNTHMPERNFENMPFAVRLSGNLFGQDVALSFYQGRHDFPLPVKNHVGQTFFDEAMCDPAVDPSDPAFDPDKNCIDGILETNVELVYPKMKVIGFNMAGEIPLDWISNSLLGLGYRFELGVYFPEKVDYTITKDDIDLFGDPNLIQPGGEYDYRLGGRRPLIVDDTPFAKWVVGLDYTFGSHVMLNLMWVHGMSDEFGAGDFLNPGYIVRQSQATTDDPLTCFFENFDFSDPENSAVTAASVCGQRHVKEILHPRIGDYAVLGVDFKFADDRALLRLFAIWDVSGYYESYYDEAAGKRVRKYLSLFDGGFSMILFPEFNYNFKNGFELGCGALLQLGNRYTKFGDPAAGGSLIWTRARYSF
ncbi:MAG TPA: hypothetical protein VM425_06635 [Myxococcota bacterium]|nr:hypothetical protein [Myxococcota bacterium]